MPRRAPSITTTRAAELIELRLGLPCTRQSLEYHLRRGNLTECVRQKSPFRLDAAKLLEEYPAKITVNHQVKPYVIPKDAPRPGRPRKSQEAAPAPDAAWCPEPIDDPPPDRPAPPQPPPPQPPPPRRSKREPELSADEQQMPALVAPTVGSKVRPNLLTSINAAKAWAELEKARKLQIERLAAEREYMRVGDVKPTWEKAFLAISRGLMGVASKIKSEHPDSSFELIESVRRECREVLAKVFDELMQLEPEPDQPTEEEQMFDLPDEGDMEFEV